jgi:alkylation response protein AidB-like acyl-CoA dehydrogenase
MSQLAGLSPDMTDTVIQTMRQVVARKLPDARILELDANDEFPHDLIRHLLSPEVGLHLIFLPEDVGGLGGGARDICRVSEEMASVDLGVATAFLAICLGSDPILVSGTEEQREQWLGRIAEEGLIVAYAVTEPEAGSNVAALKTTATPVLDDTGVVRGYRLNGAKQFITNGGVADLYTVLAKAPAGPTFFILERDTKGLSAGKTEEKHGIRSSNTTSVFLDDVEVPIANLVGGEEGAGLKQANAVFGYTRLMVGSFGLGCGQAAINRALAYAKTREQFGAPLIEKEGFNLKLLVPTWVDLAAGRAYVEQTALRLDQGENDLQVEGSIGKLWCTEAGVQATDDAMQALGGYGYTREYMVEKHRRDVRITTIYEGTSEIQRNIIGLFRWKEDVRAKGKMYEESVVELERLHAERSDLGADLVATGLRETSAVIAHCHATRLTRHQMVLFEFADMVVHAEVARALALKAARLADSGAADAELFAAMSRVLARRAVSRVLESGRLCCTGFLAPGEDIEAAEQFLHEQMRRVGIRALVGQWQDMSFIGRSLKEME